MIIGAAIWDNSLLTFSLDLASFKKFPFICNEASYCVKFGFLKGLSTDSMDKII